ncbi:MAG: protein-L-isoaspartate(D-aspartate) O-methyltransferase [Deltaproteobacteria bacterium]|nr:protein-L-isoaspartate(D-aspartate) O-methyltransferase [Deltaproteobacteria bacterium]MBW1984996.1 protein-L-isoaspartate(D-aspartate) O-methyltransferase [Deltaproteobacteria bacterium]MBW2363960.1 protein-L-isoaspartate(D-aspartate) O-methyltransferase [Deltaproteobacteria bacterium]
MRTQENKRKYFYFITGLLVSIIFVADCRVEEKDLPGFAQKRERMVRNQIEARGVKDKQVLEALRKVERHKFVPKRYQDEAYNDYPLPIGEGQTISQPYIVALMTAVLDLKGKEKVLEIGTGSGYQAAILGKICKHVYTIEIVDVLGKRSKRLLSDLGYTNITVKVGDGYKGWKEHSPFDAIIVTCAPSHIPEPLKNQLAEGGRMIIPVGESLHQKLVLLVKREGKIKQKAIIPVRFVPMMKKDGETY